MTVQAIQTDAMQAFLLCAITINALFLNLTEATFKTTSKAMSLKKYEKKYKDRKHGAAYVRPEDLPEIANLLREQGLKQVWISRFNGKQYENTELVIKMVGADNFRRVFEENLWLDYGPEPASFVYKDHQAVLIPVVVGIKSRDAEEKEIHGLYWSKDGSSDSEDDDTSGATRIRPKETRRRQTGNPQRASVNLTGLYGGSGPTLLLQPSSSSSQQSHTARHQSISNTGPNVSVIPLFNPLSQGSPSPAFADTVIGQVPRDSATILVPNFTTNGPLTPRGSSGNTNQRREQKQVRHGRQDEYPCDRDD